MIDIFTQLSAAIEGNLLIALGAAFLWGILSILLSPCHLGSLPLIIGFISGQGQVTTRRAFSLALLFAVGILITIALVGVVTAGLGRMMGDVGRFGNYFVAAIFFLVGLYLLEIIPQFSPNAPIVNLKRKGLPAAFILGLIFGIALGPCTFAFMAPMLAVAFRSGSENLLTGSSLLLVYGIGHTSVIVVAGTSTEIVQRYLNWNEKSKGLTVVKKICGGLVIIAGIYLIYTAS
jgi:cytochrome c-type biogenesis protein